MQTIHIGADVRTTPILFPRRVRRHLPFFGLDDANEFLFGFHFSTAGASAERDFFRAHETNRLLSPFREPSFLPAPIHAPAAMDIEIPPPLPDQYGQQGFAGGMQYMRM